MTGFKRTISALAALAVALLLGGLCGYAVAQDMSEPQRLLRCENIRARLAELEAEAAYLRAQRESLWSDNKENGAEFALEAIFRLKSDPAALGGTVSLPRTDFEDLDRAIARTWTRCMDDMQRTPGPGDAAAIRARNNKVCLQALWAGLARAIDDARRQLGRTVEIVHAIDGLNAQIQEQRKYLAARACEVPAGEEILRGEWHLEREADTGWMRLWLARDGRTLTGYLGWDKHIGTAVVESVSIEGAVMKFHARYATGEDASYQGTIEDSTMMTSVSGTMTSTLVKGGNWRGWKTKQ